MAKIRRIVKQKLFQGRVAQKKKNEKMLKKKYLFVKMILDQSKVF